MPFTAMTLGDLVVHMGRIEKYEINIDVLIRDNWIIDNWNQDYYERLSLYCLSMEENHFSTHLPNTVYFISRCGCLAYVMKN